MGDTNARRVTEVAYDPHWPSTSATRFPEASHLSGYRYHPGLGRDHQLVTGVEFLVMLVPHIQLRFECKIRLDGALSTTLRKRWGWIETTSGQGSTRPTDPEHGESGSVSRPVSWLGKTRGRVRSRVAGGTGEILLALVSLGFGAWRYRERVREAAPGGSRWSPFR